MVGVPLFCTISLLTHYRILLGANGSSTSDPNPTHKRTDLMLIAGLINHPEFGLILFETGSAEDIQRVLALRTAFPCTH